MNNKNFTIEDNDILEIALDNKVIEVFPTLENIEITPSKKKKIYKSENEYGYDTVTVKGVTNSIDENIIPDNIKKDVEILGVIGTLENQNVDDYFETTITRQNVQNFGINSLIKKTPSITISPDVTNLAYAFNSSPIKNVNLIGETSQVTVCNNMFSNCSKLEEAPMFNTQNVTNMSYMFYNAKITTIPLYNTSKVENMAHMFDNCNSLKTIPKINTSSVTNMDSMFQYTSNLEILPELDASSLINVSNIFMGTKNNFKNFGGFKNYGKAFSTEAVENKSSYSLILSSCPNLTHDSLMNVINGLYDIKTAGIPTQRLILGATNLAKLTEEEKAIATNKGWSLS